MKRRLCPADERGRSCSFLIDREKLVGTCHRCGRQLPVDPIPVIPRGRTR